MVKITNLPLQASMPVAGVPDGVEIARQTLQSLNPGDEGYFNAVSELASKLMTRFRNSGNPNDLDDGVLQTRELLALTSPGDRFHLAVRSNLGMALRTRFKLRGAVEDLTEAINCFEATVESCTSEHPLYIGFVVNLASGLLNRYWRNGDVADIDRIIQVCSSVLSAGSSGDAHRDSLLNNLATALKERFQQRGNRADLDLALEHYKECLGLRPPGHPLRCTVLGNLADTMLVKFETDGDIQDLESVASHYVSVLQLCPPGDASYLTGLTSLGATFWYSWLREGDAQKLDMAIGCYSTALAQSTVPNLDHVRILDNYGAALLARHFKSGNMNDLNQAIEYLTTSQNIQPAMFSSRNITALHLGTALFTRFSVVGNIADLDMAIETYGSAVQSCPPAHQQRHALLSSYGRALAVRFDEKGDENDLTLAISTCKEALALTSPTTSTYRGTVANLTTTMLISLRISGNIDELQTVIDLCDRALAAPQSEADVILSKANRAKAFLAKFIHGRDKKDIDIAVDSFREVVPLLSEGHTEHTAVYLDLAMALETRFHLTALHGDLHESIELYRIVHRSCKRGHFGHLQVRIDLGNALCSRFEFSNDAVDALDEAIVLLSEAEEILALTPGNSSYKPCLINLGKMLFLRFKMQQNISDLDMAVERVSRALTLSPSSEDFMAQSSLAVFFSARYEVHKVLGDLEHSVSLFDAVAQKMPPKHLNRAPLCRNYGRALIGLSKYRDPIPNLNSAIIMLEEALEHLPTSHPDQPSTYISLAEALYGRAVLRRDEDELHTARKLLRAVVNMVPDYHPSMREVHRGAAPLNMKLYELSNFERPEYMEESFASYEKAAHYSHSRSFQSVATGLDWVNLAEKLHHPSALRAYQTSLTSLNHLLLSTASVKNRHAIFLGRLLSSKHAASLATDATSCALDQGQIELAIELLEQGRGLLWSQMSRIRTPLDSLRSADEEGQELASEFERIGVQLAKISVPEYDATIVRTRLSVEEAARQYRQLTNELDSITARIQAKEGFQSFLGRMSFQILRSAAAKGPVILVNLSRKRCDAIIILHDEAPRLVPLPNATIESIAAMSTDLYQTLKTTSCAGEEKLRERQLVPILRNLWEIVVRPVVEELSKFLPRGSRIWWCPTSRLTSLPLHAAGPYRKGAQNLPSIYIPSYTPTLTALIRSRSEKKDPGKFPALVAIGQSNPSGESELKAVDSELDLVRSLVPPSMTFDHLSGNTGTADAAMEALRTHSWVHLACHGDQDLSQPFDSSFALRDRPLTLLDIVRAQLEHPEFAFLSACHTAVGDKNTPDEVIHLAAGMQFSGFRSVIGTMWAVDDEMAQIMVREFYKNMFAGNVLDCTNAARALNRASKTVDQAAVSIDQRIVFIHIGA